MLRVHKLRLKILVVEVLNCSFHFHLTIIAVYDKTSLNLLSAHTKKFMNNRFPGNLTNVRI